MHCKRTLSQPVKQRTHDASSLVLQECVVLLDFLCAVHAEGSLFRQPGVGQFPFPVARGEGGTPVADCVPPSATGDLK